MKPSLGYEEQDESLEIESLRASVTPDDIGRMSEVKTRLDDKQKWGSETQVTSDSLSEGELKMGYVDDDFIDDDVDDPFEISRPSTVGKFDKKSLIDGDVPSVSTRSRASSVRRKVVR